MTAKKPAGEKTPVIPTHEVKVLQLFVCSSIRRLGYIKPNITAHLVTTGLAKETDADNKHRFSKTKPLLPLKQAVEKEDTQLCKSNSEKVAIAIKKLVLKS